MKAPSFQHLRLAIDETGTAVLAIHRPDKLNALNRAVLEELDRAVAHVEENSAINVLIITGSGEKAFVAGADIGELRSLDRKSGEQLSARGQHIFGRIESSAKPVIAVINGYALGGGAELAMACHLRIATENAVIGLPEVSLGLIPGYGGTQRLPWLVGKAKAMEMILTGKPVKADEALDTGLVGKVLPAGDALDYAKKLATTIRKNGPVAVSGAIAAVNSACRSRGYAREAALFGRLCDTEDAKEGTAAFLEKRPPGFKGK